MKTPRRESLFAAFVAGQAAGLAMLAVAMLLAVSMGRSPLFPLQVMTFPKWDRG